MDHRLKDSTIDYVFDRGKDVIPIFWLIYKLEKEAQDAGGNNTYVIDDKGVVLAQ